MKIPVTVLAGQMGPGWHDGDPGDQAFWRLMGRTRGVIQMARQLHRAQKQNLFSLCREDKIHLWQRRVMLRILLCLSMLESPLAQFGWPRFFGRFSVQVVWDIYMRVEYLADCAGTDIHQIVETDEEDRCRLRTPD